jgi:molybdate/tungstate transport system substrate-binding protein
MTSARAQGGNSGRNRQTRAANRRFYWLPVIERLGHSVGDGFCRGCRWLSPCCILLTPAAQAAGTVDVPIRRLAGEFDGARDRPRLQQGERVQFQGYAGGSKLLAKQIKGKLQRGDIFISADPGVNNSLMGAANGARVSWYVSFAESPLVIGYNPNSRFAANFRSKPWYQILTEPGIKIGRTDPKI